MGKKKPSKSNPDALKEEGNKAFANGSYQMAIDFYSQAIDLKQSHIYYANRANAHLELGNFENCIQDCDEAIKIEPSFVKSYIRKGNALFNSKRVTEAKDAFEQALKIESTDEIKNLIEECIKDMEYEDKVPKDNPMKIKFSKLVEEQTKEGSINDKVKIRWFTQDFRGVVAAQPIQNGDTIFQVPFKLIITS